VSAGERLYVVRIELESNRVVLGRRQDLATNEMTVTDAHFLPFDQLTAPLTVDVRIRYRSAAVPATIHPKEKDQVRVLFHRPVAGVTPGQAAVFYDRDIVVGGGTIKG